MSVEYNPKSGIIDIKGKPFLQAHDAITWFWQDHPAPSGRINTSIDHENKIVRAEVYVDNTLVSTAHKKGDGQSSLEKMETGAVRRALANLGYGTVAALAYDEGESDGLSPEAAARVVLGREDGTNTEKRRKVNNKPKRVVTNLSTPVRAQTQIAYVDTIAERNGSYKYSLMMTTGEIVMQYTREEFKHAGWVTGKDWQKVGVRHTLHPTPTIEIEYIDDGEHSHWQIIKGSLENFNVDIHEWISKPIAAFGDTGVTPGDAISWIGSEDDPGKELVF